MPKLPRAWKTARAVRLENGVGFGTTEFHVLRAKSDADPRFIFHWTQAETLRKQAETQMTGSAGQRRVPAEFFNRFEIPLIGIDEQRYIAKILDTVDKVIQITEALIAKHKQLKAGLLHHLLTRGIDKNGRLRDPLRHPEQFKDSPLGLIPKEWDVLTIEQCMQRQIIIDIQDGNLAPENK